MITEYLTKMETYLLCSRTTLNPSLKSQFENLYSPENLHTSTPTISKFPISSDKFMQKAKFRAK